MTVDLSWLPDWRNESEYPAPDELPLRLWAWEFLRRNPEFQKDVDRIPKEFFEILRNNFLKWLNFSSDEWNHAVRVYHTFEMILLLEKFNLLFVGYCDCEGYYGGDEYYDLIGNDEYIEMSNKHGVRIIEHYKNSFPVTIFNSEYLVKDYSFNYDAVSSPDFDNSPNKLACGNDFLLSFKNAPILSFTSRNKVNVTYSIDLPLDVQFAFVKEHIETFVESITEWEKSKKIKLRSRIDREKFPLYLRVLDGRSSGATYKEIADVLIPHLKSYDEDYPMKTIKNYHNAAIKIRDCGYFSIAAMETHKIFL